MTYSFSVAVFESYGSPRCTVFHCTSHHLASALDMQTSTSFTRLRQTQDQNDFFKNEGAAIVTVRIYLAA